MVICVEQGADNLDMVQLMPLPPNHFVASLTPRMGYRCDTGVPAFYRKKRWLKECTSSNSVI